MLRRFITSLTSCGSTGGGGRTATSSACEFAVAVAEDSDGAELLRSSRMTCPLPVPRPRPRPCASLAVVGDIGISCFTPRGTCTTGGEVATGGGDDGGDGDSTEEPIIMIDESKVFLTGGGEECATSKTEPGGGDIDRTGGRGAMDVGAFLLGSGDDSASLLRLSDETDWTDLARGLRSVAATRARGRGETGRGETEGGEGDSC